MSGISTSLVYIRTSQPMGHQPLFVVALDEAVTSTLISTRP